MIKIQVYSTSNLGITIIKQRDNFKQMNCFQETQQGFLYRLGSL